MSRSHRSCDPRYWLWVRPIRASARLATMDSGITLRTLTDGGQTAQEVAGWIADFLNAAERSLDLAHYDFNLLPETAAVVGGAIRAAAGRGVAVRFVRDGDTLWTGSTNWTDDSWSREENVVAIVSSPELARAFELNFEEIWSETPIEATGKVEPRPVRVAAVQVRPWFTPGYGEDLSHRIAKMIGRAKQRVRIASPIITSAPILGTVAQAACDGRVELAGVVDLTQVWEVLHQWRENGATAWKIPLLETAL